MSVVGGPPYGPPAAPGGGGRGPGPGDPADEEKSGEFGKEVWTKNGVNGNVEWVLHNGRKLKRIKLTVPVLFYLVIYS